MRVVCIDAFDHLEYDDPAAVAPGILVRRARPKLLVNYAGGRGSTERYHFLAVTSQRPRVVGTAKAERRYHMWQQLGVVGPAMQALLLYTVTGRPIVKHKLDVGYTRDGMDVTPPGATSELLTTKRIPKICWMLEDPPNDDDASESPLYAIGCTCDDFKYRCVHRNGTKGPSYNGCKHMEMYNLCAPEAITFPKDD